MFDVKRIRQSAHIVNDERGLPVVQVPLDLWESLLAQIEHDKPQHERFQEFLREWAEYSDDSSEEWWNEFNAFLKANRLHFAERDLHLDDE